MIVIACLGNPGNKYRKNRHNIGFFFADYISDLYGISIAQEKFQARYGTGQIESKDSLITCPATYMNNSGVPIQNILSFFKVPPSKLIVVHDELEIPFGEVRHKFGGGHKGHNGLRSIIQQLGTPDFHRLRFGIGRPMNPEQDVADYVLSNFTSEEQSLLPEKFILTGELLADIIKEL